jgi:hypothetical protein
VPGSASTARSVSGGGQAAGEGARSVREGGQAVNDGYQVSKTPAGRYGYVPAWLGKSKVSVGRMVTASPAHPWLAVQGDTVLVKLPQATVVATVSGPSVPEQGHFPLPATSPCTFIVTLAAASAPVQIRSRQFATIDEDGRLHSVRMTSLNRGAAPAEVKPGKAVNLKLSVVLPTGEGRLMWAPVAGQKPVVQWDFDVEID